MIIFFQHHAINPSTSLRAAWAFLFILLAPLFIAERTFAHEVWIEPHSAHLSKGENLLADLRIGDMFKGDHLIYIPQQTEKLLVLMESGSFDLQPKIGSRPVVLVPSEKLDGISGDLVVVYESANSYIQYGTEEKFFRFAEKKGLAAVRKEHERRRLPEGGFVERYKRFAKASVAFATDAEAGTQKINDRPVGMELEFVLLAKSNLSNGLTAFDVQLFYQDKGLPDALVTLFSRDPDGTVTTSQFKTNEQGMIKVTARAGHRYLLDHVTVRETDPSRDRNKPVWESLWASLTFSGAES